MMNPSQYCVFFLVSLIFHTLASSTLQRDALLEFKKEFPIVARAPDPDEPFGPPLSSWNISSDYCSWEGVTCDGKSGEVISLVLDSVSLNGSLKSNSSLFKLQHLRRLSIRRCDLIGKIPSSIGNLSRLTELYLSENHLLGKIPSSLGNLSCLTFLVLADNHLIGEVPLSIGNLNQLTFLSLPQNNLSGNIPISFANLTKLSNLFLSNNQFTGGDLPRILPNLTSLSYLDLGHNHIKSTLPSDMSRLQNLESFDVGGNSFLGNFPTTLFTIPSLIDATLQGSQFEGLLEFGNISSSSMLQFLDVSFNNFYGPIPESISRFLNLGMLDLSHNSFIGPIPGSLSKLVNLSSLDLSYNKLQGQIPSFVWRLQWLTLSHNSFSSFSEPEEVLLNGTLPDKYDLGSNSLQGLFPKWICKVTSLTLLDLSNNHLSGSIPLCLKNSIVSLRDLILRNNSLSGVLPDIFINSTELKSLDVSRNQLVGKLPRSLISCNSMEFLNVRGNNIKDTFPSWLESLASLRVLLIGLNAFYGPIYSPSTYSGFPVLRVIDISHNSFNGTLPQDYFANWLEMSTVWVDETDWFEHTMDEGSPYSVYMGEINSYQDSMEMVYKGVQTEFSRVYLGYKAIDFSGNQFKGRIPKSIGLLKELRLLNLSGNAFTGNIPSSLANITNLEALDLSHNKLSGQIPHDLGNLSFVSYLDFSHNHLEGPVPRSTQFLRQNCSSFEDNLRLYGLEEICGEIHVPDATSQQPEELLSEQEQVLNWIAAAIAYGPGVFCGLVIGHIFTSQKHEWFMEKFHRNKPTGNRNVRKCCVCSFFV